MSVHLSECLSSPLGKFFLAVSTRKLPNKGSRFEHEIFSEALESGMCDFIKIR